MIEAFTDPGKTTEARTKPAANNEDNLISQKVADRNDAKKQGGVYALKGAGRSNIKPARQAKKRPPRLCPVLGCKNKAAPVFGMMCREHKDLPKAERDKLFATQPERV